MQPLHQAASLGVTPATRLLSKSLLLEVNPQRLPSGCGQKEQRSRKSQGPVAVLGAGGAAEAAPLRGTEGRRHSPHPPPRQGFPQRQAGLQPPARRTPPACHTGTGRTRRASGPAPGRSRHVSTWEAEEPELPSTPPMASQESSLSMGFPRAHFRSHGGDPQPPPRQGDPG